jgi:hypothetical protein
MKKIIRLTESDLVRVIEKIINEQPDPDFSANEFDKKKEEFTKEDFLNWKEYSRKKYKDRNYIPTNEERKAHNKYTRLKRLGQDPIAAFRGIRKEEEPFTQEDYLNWREYSRKKSKDRNYIPTDEERKGLNKYTKLRRLGQDPIAAYRGKGKEIEEEPFTMEEYLTLREYSRKKSKDRNYIPTEEEREAHNKYARQSKKGLNPIAAFRGIRKKEEEEPFTMEEYLTLREYKRKIQKDKNYIPTEEEREAYNKYVRQLRKGLDPIAAFRKQEKNIKEEPLTMEEYLTLREYTRKIQKDRKYIPTEEERKVHNKYVRQSRKGLDPIAAFRGIRKKEEEKPFTMEEYLNLKSFRRGRRISKNYTPTEEERKAHNKYVRQKLKGLDPLAPFRKEEEPFTQEDYLNWREYTRKKYKDRNYIPTNEERKAYNKYTRLKRLGQDPIAAYRGK